MKKHLLFGFAAFTALAVNAQNANKSTANLSVKKMVTLKTYPSAETSNSQISPAINPKVNPKINSTNKTASAPVRIGGSVNSIGVQNTDGRALHYNAAVNTVAMVLRKQAGWSGVTGGNSGTMAYAYSINGGATWDSTILAASATNLMRHPGGTLYNPLGNTNPSNAYAVGSGPWHPGSNWQGNFFASKQLTFPGNNNTGNVIYQDNLALTAGQRKQDFARTDMQATTDGKVHVLGGLYSDINSTTAAGQAFRGVMLNTGTFNAGSFTWTVDSLKPNFKADGAGAKQNFSGFNQAWSEDGTVGYVVFDGVDANAAPGTSANTFQPYVYKTTNSGATWARHAPLFDFTTIPSVADRTFPAHGGLLKPFISTGEGGSATVDVNGNLHFLATMVSSSSDHIDSLGFTYNVDFTNTWQYIVDFNTTSNGWCAFVIDSLKTDGPTATETNWTGGASGALAYDARLQISRSTNGMVIVYSWVDSDPAIVGSTFNLQPSIFMKAYDIATNSFSGTKNMSSGKPSEYYSYWFLTSPTIMNPSAGNYVVPTLYTVSDDGSLIPDNPVSYYYMNDNTFSNADFVNLNVGSCTPTGIKQQSNNAFENLNFYPNPAATAATVDVQLNETAKVDITILNSVGQAVYSTTISGNIGSNKVNVNLSNLSSGLYFYQVKIGNSKAITKKFAVEK